MFRRMSESVSKPRRNGWMEPGASRGPEDDAQVGRAKYQPVAGYH